MAEGNFEGSFARTLRYEGGYVNDPHDPGGMTNLGVTRRVWEAYVKRPATEAEMRALTPRQVEPVYRLNYWNAVRSDELPDGVDSAVYDFAVNSGVTRAIMALQRAVHVADDGKIGDITMKAIKSQTPDYLVKAICNDRLAFLKRLSTWPRYGKGWGARVSSVRKTALAMIKEG
jgi:lysozyme family protein